ncbi:MAG: hypothetical protein IPM66_10225 [Acidobacteriota bacterium]|nr:MAG: hypothetical protein IPM66_10225 [Acidobacteriota bacterium]
MCTGRDFSTNTGRDAAGTFPLPEAPFSLWDCADTNAGSRQMNARMPDLNNGYFMTVAAADGKETGNVIN